MPFYRSIAINIIHAESPVEFVGRLSSRGDVDGLQEFPEVDLARVVRVKRAKDVLTELLRVAGRVEL